MFWLNFYDLFWVGDLSQYEGRPWNDATEVFLSWIEEHLDPENFIRRYFFEYADDQQWN